MEEPRTGQAPLVRSATNPKHFFQSGFVLYVSTALRTGLYTMNVSLTPLALAAAARAVSNFGASWYSSTGRGPATSTCIALHCFVTGGGGCPECGASTCLTLVLTHPAGRLACARRQRWRFRGGGSHKLAHSLPPWDRI
jgi:hypothetical protein